MTTPREVVAGYQDSGIDYTVPLTCFTEIRLSEAKSHAAKYGQLGLGFQRRFVIERCGGPVKYVSGDDRDPIIGNLDLLLGALTELGKTLHPSSLRGALKRVRDHPDPDTRVYLQELLERLLVLTQAKVQGQVRDDRLALLTNGLGIVFAHMKPMSSDPNDEDFEYFEEAEWRIVHTHRAEAEELLVETGTQRPPFRIPFEPHHLKVLVFPDADTQRLAFADETIRQWFGDPAAYPVIATVGACEQF